MNNTTMVDISPNNLFKFRQSTSKYEIFAQI